MFKYVVFILIFSSLIGKSILLENQEMQFNLLNSGLSNLVNHVIANHYDQNPNHDEKQDKHLHKHNHGPIEHKHEHNSKRIHFHGFESGTNYAILNSLSTILGLIEISPSLQINNSKDLFSDVDLSSLYRPPIA